MTNPKIIRTKLVNLFGEETGAEKFKAALVIRAEEGISLAEAVNRLGDGHLNESSFKTEKKHQETGWPPNSDIPKGHVLNEVSFHGTKPVEIVNELKSEFPEALIFVQNGYFYEVYNKDAYVCSKIFGWKIADYGNDFEFTGVPINAFRFKEELRNEGQNYIIIIQRDYPSDRDLVTRIVNEVYLN